MILPAITLYKRIATGDLHRQTKPGNMILAYFRIIFNLLKINVLFQY